MMDYIIGKVPSEIQLLKRLRRHRVERVKKAFAEIVPSVTKNREAGVAVFRRMGTGQSQRGRSRGWENSVIQGGDILAAPGVGMYAYVLREGETEPPPEIKKLWAEYLKIDKILADTIRTGLTPREIIQVYTRKFEEEGIILRDDQLHMVNPKNDFPVYSEGFAPEKTHLSVDAHGMMKGARERDDENYLGPRIGSYGPDWTKDMPLPPNHHFVLEYFFYMPSPSSEREDQYLLWWDHESTIATESGVEYFSPPQGALSHSLMVRKSYTLVTLYRSKTARTRWPEAPPLGASSTLFLGGCLTNRSRIRCPPRFLLPRKRRTHLPNQAVLDS